MQFLHQALLSYRTNQLLQKEGNGRSSLNLREARQVGILFSMNSLDDYEAIREFEAKLKKEGKEVIVLCYLPKGVENFDFHYDIFSNKDFNTWGKAQAENIQQFMQHPFDLLICLDAEPNFYLGYLLAASKARFRIGPHSQRHEALFELMIRQAEGSELKELTKQIYHYTNKL